MADVGGYGKVHTPSGYFALVIYLWMYCSHILSVLQDFSLGQIVSMRVWCILPRWTVLTR
jgi:hypothetical protein